MRMHIEHCASANSVHIEFKYVGSSSGSGPLIGCHEKNVHFEMLLFKIEMRMRMDLLANINTF